MLVLLADAFELAVLFVIKLCAVLPANDDGNGKRINAPLRTGTVIRLCEFASVNYSDGRDAGRWTSEAMWDDIG